MTQTASPYRPKVRKEMLSEQIDALIVQAHHLQVSNADLVQLIKDRLERFNAQRQQAEEKEKQK